MLLVEGGGELVDCVLSFGLIKRNAGVGFRSRWRGRDAKREGDIVGWGFLKEGAKLVAVVVVIVMMMIVRSRRGSLVRARWGLGGHET